MTDHIFSKFSFYVDKTKIDSGYWKLDVQFKWQKGIIDIHNINSPLSPMTAQGLVKSKIKRFFQRLREEQKKQNSIKQKIKSMENGMEDIEKGNTDDCNYKRLKILFTIKKNPKALK